MVYSTRRRCLPMVLATLVMLSGCTVASYSGGAPLLSLPQLKYRLIDRLGSPLFCGPPVIRIPSQAEADQEVAALRSSDPATFDAIVAHEKLHADKLTTDDERHILDEQQRLQALVLNPESDHFTFDYTVNRSAPHEVKGTIDKVGAIAVTASDPTTWPKPGGCPICLAAADLIDTPSGPIPVTQLHAGMLVWTKDRTGQRIVAPVLTVGHVQAPSGHHVVRLTLHDGRTVEASPGHPTADGRRVGELRVGDTLDGSQIVAVTLIPYSGDTWDLLPAGPTGVYWANGVLLKSTFALD